MHIARRAGLVDRPGPLKVQTAPVPYLGGLAVLVAMTPTVVLSRPRWLAPLAFIFLVGLVDDARSLSPRVRLGLEAVAGLLAAWAVASQGWPVGMVLGTIVVSVALVNAVNMLDGLDALAAGVTAAGLLGFALLLHGPPSTVAWAGLGAVLGFLVFNRPPARIYLGDSGAYLLGMLLALLVVHAWGSSYPLGTSVATGFLVAVPAGEACLAILRRRRAGVSLTAGDRDHFYDQLVARGSSPAKISAILATIQVALTGASLLLVWLGVPAAVVVAIAVLSCAVALWLLGRAGFVTPSVRYPS